MKAKTFLAFILMLAVVFVLSSCQAVPDENSQPWYFAIAICTLVIVVVQVGLQIWKQNAPDEYEHIFDLVMAVLESLKKECQGELRKIPMSEVNAAATSVYRKYIASTPLAKLISESAFVDLVVEKWQELVGVEETVFQAVSLQRAMAGSASKASLN